VLRLLHSLFFSEVLHLRLTSGRLAAHTRAGITKMDTVPIKTDCSRQRVGTLVSKRDRLFVSFRARDLRLVSRFQLQDAPFCCRSACVLSGGGFYASRAVSRWSCFALRFSTPSLFNVWRVTKSDCRPRFVSSDRHDLRFSIEPHPTAVGHLADVVTSFALRFLLQDAPFHFIDMCPVDGALRLAHCLLPFRACHAHGRNLHDLRSAQLLHANSSSPSSALRFTAATGQFSSTYCPAYVVFAVFAAITCAGHAWR
jgi:hypothetical protein